MASRQNQQPAAAALDQVICQLLITCYDREVGGEGGGRGRGARRGQGGGKQVIQGDAVQTSSGLRSLGNNAKTRNGKYSCRCGC